MIKRVRKDLKSPERTLTFSIDDAEFIAKVLARGSDVPEGMMFNQNISEGEFKAKCAKLYHMFEHSLYSPYEE